MNDQRNVVGGGGSGSGGGSMSGTSREMGKLIHAEQTRPGGIFRLE